MLRHKFYIFVIIISMVFCSCKRIIDLQLGNNSGQLVIEANVTNNLGPQYIKLSQNVSLSNTNTYPPVTGAIVTVTDPNGNSFTFTEGPSGTYTNQTLAGKPGSTYNMSVITNGKTYTASSTMPDFVSLDSITYKNDNFSNKAGEKLITVHFQDPANTPNQYKFLLFVNKKQVKGIFALDDEFTDGRYVNLDFQQNDIDIFPGDTVNVEMDCIDKNMYTYWFSLEQQQVNGPGGGVTPSNPPTNITPAVLGYFSAHTTQTRTLIVK